MRATFRIRSAGVAHDEPVLRAAVAQLPLLKHDALRRDAANDRACVADAALDASLDGCHDDARCPELSEVDLVMAATFQGKLNESFNLEPLPLDTRELDT